MTTVHPYAPTADLPPAGEAEALPLQLDNPPRGELMAEYAKSGVLLLPYVEGNVATGRNPGDGTGDGYAVADLLDKLDLAGSPLVSVALSLPADDARRNEAGAVAYGILWANAITSRGYRPLIRSAPDVIYAMAKGGAQFGGAWPIAFDLADPSQPAPAPGDVPGLPGDVFPGARVFEWASNGSAVAGDGVCATVRTEPTPSPDVQTTPSGPPPPVGAQPAALPATQADVQAHAAELAAVRDELAALHDKLDGLRDFLESLVSTATEPAADAKPAGDTAPADTAAGVTE